MFNPENEFEQRLVLAVSDPGSREAFMAGLAGEAAFIALFPVDKDGNPSTLAVTTGDDGSTLLPMGATLVLREVMHVGIEMVPFFSAPSRIWAYTRDTHVTAPERVEDLFRRFPDRHFVLNPGSDFGKHFMPHEVAIVLGIAPADHRLDVAAGTKVLVGTPSANTSRIERALAAHFSKQADVASAYLSMASIGGAAPALVLEVVVDDASKADRSRIAAPLRQLASAESPIDFRLCDSRAAAVAGGAVKPFYQRSKKSFWRALLGK